MERMRVNARWMLPMTIAIALVAMPPLARSQATSPVIHLLLHGSDPRTRVQAAVTLGRLRPPGAREALEVSLGDANPAVRAASAQSLGQIGDPASLPALRARANDPDRGVRAGVAQAILQIQSRPGPAPGTSPSAPSQPMADWTRARFALRVGSLNNHANARASIMDVFRNAIIQEAGRNADVAVVPGPLPPEAERRVRAGRLRAYAIEGGINTVRRWTVADMLSVRVEVSLVLLTDPSHTIVGSLSGAATAQDRRPYDDADGLAQRLEERALMGAVRGALNNLQASLSARR